MNQDLESEKAVLSALFEHGRNALVDLTGRVKDSTFSDPIHQVFFLCLEKAISKSDKISYPLLLSSAHDLGLDDTLKENLPLIEELKNGKIELNHVQILAKKLGRLELARIGCGKLQSALTSLKKITGEENPSSILSIIEKPGYEVQSILNSGEDSGQLIGDGITSYIDELIAHPNIEVGIGTGFKEFDIAIGSGLRKGGYTLLGARPKTGKSSIALNIAMYVAEKLKIPVLFLDTEMKPKQHWPRMMANLTSIPISCIEHSSFNNNKLLVSQIKEVGKRVNKLPITHERIAGKEFDEVLSIARRWIFKTVGFNASGQTNNCLIIYDYFKLMNANSMKNLREHEILGFQASAFSDFLGDFDVACLALVQLNKEKDIAQSDRLIWLALAVAMLMTKTQEEIINDGYENGNRKIAMVDNYMRFGEGLEPDDYINLDFNGGLCQFKEIGRARQLAEEKKIGKSGFKTDETDGDYTDDDPIF